MDVICALHISTEQQVTAVRHQDFQSPEWKKFPDFSRLQLNSYACPRLLKGGGEGGLGASSPRKFSQLGCSDWLKMNFTQQNSLTFP